MEDKSLPQSIGGETLPPISLTPEQRDLCWRLDDLYKKYRLKTRASDMFQGAIYAFRIECRSNPDRVSQAANSLREILYPFWSPNVKGQNKTSLEQYGAVLIDDGVIGRISLLWDKLNKLTHHQNCRDDGSIILSKVEDFEKLISEFEMAMKNALMMQIDIHQKIDKLLSCDPSQIISDEKS